MVLHWQFHWQILSAKRSRPFTDSREDHEFMLRVETIACDIPVLTIVCSSKPFAISRIRRPVPAANWHRLSMVPINKWWQNEMNCICALTEPISRTQVALTWDIFRVSKLILAIQALPWRQSTAFYFVNSKCYSLPWHINHDGSETEKNEP